VYFVSVLHSVRPELMHTAEMPYMMCVFYRVTYFIIHFFFSFAGHISRYTGQRGSCVSPEVNAVLKVKGDKC
jgi:hypothetical protein